MLQKHVKNTTTHKIDKLILNSKKIADTLSVSNRVDRLERNEVYLTIKDHKQNFQTNPSFRPIRPTKINIGKICKTMLDQINRKIMSTIHVNQLNNSSSIIKWFKTYKVKLTVHLLYST